MITAGRTVLVTGANRGIGAALVTEALRRGAERVYAATRQPYDHPDARVQQVTLDVTDAEQIRAAVERVPALDLLINNAGIVDFDDFSDPTVLDRMMAVNFYGVRDVTQAFLPRLVAAGGAVATNISMNAFAAFPLVSSCSVSKAATFNMMQSLRIILAPKGVRVHSVLTGNVDTDMTRGFDMPKSPPELVAQGVFEGIEKDQDDIFPDPMSATLADDWNNGASKALERQFAEMYAHLTQQG